MDDFLQKEVTYTEDDMIKKIDEYKKKMIFKSFIVQMAKINNIDELEYERQFIEDLLKQTKQTHLAKKKTFKMELDGQKNSTELECIQEQVELLTNKLHQQKIYTKLQISNMRYLLMDLFSELIYMQRKNDEAQEEVEEEVESQTNELYNYSPLLNSSLEDIENLSYKDLERDAQEQFEDFSNSGEP